MASEQSGSGNVPIPYSQFLSLNGKWTYDPDARQYTLAIVPSPAMANDRRIVAGGYLMSVFDLVAERLVIAMEDVSSAVTLHMTHFFRRAARCNQPLTVTVTASPSQGTLLNITGTISSGRHTIAQMISWWSIRPAR